MATGRENDMARTCRVASWSFIFRSFFKEKEGNATTDARAFDAQWPKLYGELAGIGSLTMTDTGFRSDSLFE